MTRAIIVGGGIGGLTAAVALRRVGVEAVVFDRADELREIGAGISIWTNAMKALEELGLAAAVRAAEVLERFGGWHEPVPAVIRATPEAEILRNDAYDRESLKSWGEGRVTLLGDAAHPITPNLGQGACQAIEDAAELAGCLREGGDVALALRLYEDRRRGRTAEVARRSRLLGRVVQLENPLLCAARNAPARAIPVRLQLRQLEAVLAHGT